MAMTREEILGHIREIVVEKLSVEPQAVTLEARFRDDLNADSLDLAEMIMDFEDKFEIGNIGEEDANKIQTVGDAVEYIYGRVAAGAV